MFVQETPALEAVSIARSALLALMSRSFREMHSASQKEQRSCVPPGCSSGALIRQAVVSRGQHGWHRPCVRSLALVDTGQHFGHHGLLDCWAMTTPSQILVHDGHQLNSSKMVVQKGDCRFTCAELRRRNATLLSLLDFAEKLSEEEASVRLPCGSKSRGGVIVKVSSDVFVP